MVFIQLIGIIGLFATLVYASATYGFKAGLLIIVALLCQAIGAAGKGARK